MSDFPIPTELTITLRDPITFAKQDYTEFTVREPKGKQLVAASKAQTSMEGVMVLIQLTAGIPAGVVDQIPQTELQEADDFFASFQRPAKKVSETSSET